MLPLVLLILASCVRETDSYDVQLYGDGVWLDEVEPAGEPMQGAIEVARYRLWGANLGHGITGFFGDQPFQDGSQFTIAWGEVGYPADPSYDTVSAFLSPGPAAAPTEDACLTRFSVVRSPSISEYVDLGDRIVLEGEGARFELPRDPAVHPRPAGEAFFVAYGGALGPVVQDNALLDDTWTPGQWTLTYPGALQPEEATFGAVPYPGQATVIFPEQVDGLTVGGDEVRQPFVLLRDSDVRFDGPWEAPMELGWTPSQDGSPLTVTVRYLGYGAENACDCATDCGDGFFCEGGWCSPAEGSGWVVLGELSCTVEDDGAFTLDAATLERLDAVYDPRTPVLSGVAGAVLMVSRMEEGTVAPADVLTWNDKRIPASPIRTRVIDTLVTRLDLP